MRVGTGFRIWVAVGRFVMHQPSPNGCIEPENNHPSARSEGGADHWTVVNVTFLTLNNCPFRHFKTRPPSH